jgi:Tol biopolymer transport system component
MDRTVCLRRAFALALTAPLVALAFSCGDDSPPGPRETAYEPPPDTVWLAPTLPFYARDGRTIYFLGLRSDSLGRGLYRADLAGDSVREILFDRLDKEDIRLSPDGRTVSYAAAAFGLTYCCANLWTADLETGARRAVTPGFLRFGSHRWSPDGRFIVGEVLAEGDDGAVHRQIARVSPDGSGWTLLTRAPYDVWDPRWDARGGRIYARSDDAVGGVSGYVSVMDSSGGERRAVDAAGRYGSAPRPSPVRDELALYLRPGPTGEDGGYLVAAGPGAFPAAQTGFRRISPRFPPMSEWSPDGEFIAQAYDDPPTGRTRDLFVVRRSDGHLRRLTTNWHVESFSWAPDARAVVCVAADAAGTKYLLRIIDIVTGSVRTLNVHL